MFKTKLILLVFVLFASRGLNAEESVVIEPIWIVKISPAYPPKALLAQIEGWVTVQMSISERGTVDSVEILASKPERMFNEATKAAVMKFKFTPKTIDGKSVPSKAQITINFELPDTKVIEEDV